MKYIITVDCINCGACVIVCSEEAIYSYKTKPPFSYSLSYEHYFIVPEKCTQCKGLESPECFNVCPMNSIKLSA